MSRSGYSDDCDDNWAMIRYAGAINSAIKGKRGQEFLKEMLTALDAMPVKELVEDVLEENGSYCALGVVGKVRGIDMSTINPANSEQVSKVFGIADALAREIVYHNDEYLWYSEATPSKRWQHVRDWVHQNILPVSLPESSSKTNDIAPQEKE